MACITGIFWIALGVVAAQVDGGAPIASEPIARAIEQLGAPAFVTRQAATELLWKAGAAAEPALREAAKSTDPEVRARAAALLGKLQLGLRPDTPPELAALIDQFRYAETPILRRQALSELQAKGHWQAILALIRGEQNPEQRRTLAVIISGEAGKLLRPLVEQGELAQAREVLELVATAESGLPQLTSFLLLTGQLDNEIESLQARTAHAARDEDWTRLAYLLRAKGDLSAATAAADNTSDPFLRANLLAEGRRFNDAATVASEIFAKHPTRLEAAAFAATFYRLADNTADQQRTIEALLKAANVDRLKDLQQPQRPADPFGAPASNVGLSFAWAAAETLLINERLDDAIPILRKINPRFVHAIYWRQHRHREALEYVGVKDDKALDRSWFDELPALPTEVGAQQEGRFALAAQVARQLRELGRKEQLDQILETLHGLARPGNDQGRRMTSLAALEWQVGRYDDVVRDAAEAIGAGSPPATVFGALLKQHAPLALGWYERWLSDDPLADRQRTFEKALWLAVPQPPRERMPADWRRTIIAAHAAAEKLEPREKAQRLLLLGQTCEIRGDRSLARRYFGEAASADPTTAIRAADMALADSDWSAAAELYEKLAKLATADPLADYLHGYCVTKNGDPAAGAKHMRLASLTALAPEARLRPLAMGLKERGLKDAAIEQLELVRRTALPDSPQAASAAQLLGDLFSLSQPLLAAESWEQFQLHLLNPSSNFSEVEGYLTLSHIIHKLRAKAALTASRADEVEAELKRCDQILPGDVRLLVELIPLLKRAGLESLANKLFEQGLAVHERVYQEFVASATYLNNAAWLCARSQQRLDEGLSLVERALVLAPEEAAYHDTLAEVRFQRGEREAAVAAATRAAELAPANKLFAARLKHFQNDDLKTLDGAEGD